MHWNPLATVALVTHPIVLTRMVGMCHKVASHMRAVLRTVAQCHSHRILHRDVKPGNFMLLNDSPNAPLKAIGTKRFATL